MLAQYKKLQVIITSITIGIFISFFSVNAVSPLEFFPTYNADENSIRVKTNTNDNIQTAFYYKNNKANINGVFGENDTNLPAETCSAEDCIEDEFIYGILKVFVPSEELLEVIYFKRDGDILNILKQDTYENLKSSAKTASENSLLKLQQKGENWLKNPTDLTLTPTIPPSPSLTPAQSVKVLASSTSISAEITPSLTPSPTPASPITPGTCTPGQGWVNGTENVSPGMQLDGVPVPLYRSHPSYAFGPPDQVFYSLGRGGSVTYKFAGEVLNEPGDDITIYEFTYGRSTYPIEQVRIEVSENGTNWYELTFVGNSRINDLGVNNFDFEETGLQSIQYIRLTDIINPSNINPESDGFDINAIGTTSQACGVVSTPIVTPSVTPTNSPTPTVTLTPIPSPTVTPTDSPTPSPTNTPTLTPTNTPTNSPTPTNTPTSTPTQIPNQAPVANAGDDKEITLPQDVQLDGVVNDDGLPEGSTLLITWEKVSGPGIVSFGGSLLTPIVSFSEAGTYVLSLTVDDSELFDTDTVTIIVNPAPTITPSPTVTPSVTPTNSPTPTNTPTPTIPEPTNTPTNTPTPTPSATPSPTLTPTNSPTPTVTSTPTPSPTVTPTPSDSPTPTPTATATPSPTPTNQPPQISAGPDKVIIHGQDVLLEGSVSDDGQPNPPATINTSWELVSGPGEIVFEDPDPITPTVSFSIAGVYTFSFSATDSVLESSDTMVVTVNPAPTPTSSTGATVTSAVVANKSCTNGTCNLIPLEVNGTNFNVGNTVQKVLLKNGPLTKEATPFSVTPTKVAVFFFAVPKNTPFNVEVVFTNGDVIGAPNTITVN